MSNRKVKTIYLDSCIFIYLLENHATYANKVQTYFKKSQSHTLDLYTSTLTMHEVMTASYKHRDDSLSEELYAMLATFPGLSWTPYTLEIADRSAQIRAFSKLPTPDTIHIATAIETSCSQFITNDRRIKNIPELEIIQLSH